MFVTNIKDIDDFNKLILSNKKILIDFYADWCNPCKMISPIFDELSIENKDIIFAKVNVEKLSDIAQEYCISSIPTLIFFKNSKEFSKHVGFLTKEQIKSFINK